MGLQAEPPAKIAAASAAKAGECKASWQQCCKVFLRPQQFVERRKKVFKL